jgi:O2-independent ubiquinone biosynthesis protein UbiU
MSKSRASCSPSAIIPAPEPASMELTCAVVTLEGLKAAIDNGADCVRLDCCTDGGAKDAPDCFSNEELTKSVQYAVEHQTRMCLQLDCREPGMEHFEALRATLSRATECGVRTVSLSSPELILYARVHWADVRIHYIASDSVLSRRGLLLAHNRLGFVRVVLPRVLGMAQLRQLAGIPGIEYEVIGWGPRCALFTGALTNGAMAPWTKRTIPDVEKCCADSESACNDAWNAGTCIDTKRPLSLLPMLKHLGVRSLIVEVPYRASSRVAQVTALWRAAIDRCEAQTRRSPPPSSESLADRLFAGFDEVA